jgi:hypothetical protein
MTILKTGAPGCPPASGAPPSHSTWWPRRGRALSKFYFFLPTLHQCRSHTQIRALTCRTKYFTHPSSSACLDLSRWTYETSRQSLWLCGWGRAPQNPGKLGRWESTLFFLMRAQAILVIALLKPLKLTCSRCGGTFAANLRSMRYSLNVVLATYCRTRSSFAKSSCAFMGALCLLSECSWSARNSWSL